MKRTASVFLALLFLLASLPAACADLPHQNAVCELYSADGYYVDGVGNRETYSYHVPQISAGTPAAEELNTEIAERFGERVETQFHNMEGGFSLWSWHTQWHAYWSGSRLFLLVQSDGSGDYRDYAAYGYDFETGSRVTNAQILEEKGISEEEYLERLRETVRSMCEEMYGVLSPEIREAAGCDELLEKTLGWLDMDQPMFIDEFGEIETIVKIASVAGAGWYYYIAAPFSASEEATYAITVVGDTFLVESCPESAKAGETVTVLTYDVTDGDKEISVIGADGVSIDWFEYQFVMPDHDVEVRVEFISNGLA